MLEWVAVPFSTEPPGNSLHSVFLTLKFHHAIALVYLVVSTLYILYSGLHFLQREGKVEAGIMTATTWLKEEPPVHKLETVSSF